MPSVLLISGMPNASITTTAISWPAMAATHTSGPQPRSTHRICMPVSSKNRPVPHRRAATTHHSTDGP